MLSNQFLRLTGRFPDDFFLSDSVAASLWPPRRNDKESNGVVANP
jgi:hypothetical protein